MLPCVTTHRISLVFLMKHKMCSRISRNLFRFDKILRGYSCSYAQKVAKRSLLLQTRLFSADNPEKKISAEVTAKEDEHNLSGTVASKYQIFRDEDSPIIFDVDEERKKITLEELNAPQELQDAFEGLNMERGVNGVFEIDDLVQLLQKDNAQDIFVASVPPELVYVDYIVIVTGRSQRHMKALAQFVRRAFKKKRHPGDTLPKIEGGNSKDWLALDLGNIALHIFSKEARTLYDLESLWSVGSEFDDEYNKPSDRITQLLERHSLYLAGLQPADNQ